MIIIQPISPYGLFESKLTIAQLFTTLTRKHEEAKWRSTLNVRGVRRNSIVTLGQLGSTTKQCDPISGNQSSAHDVENER